MPKFYMTDDEIRRDYTKAKDRKRQLGILADMNCVSKAAMRNKLIELGLILGTPTEEKEKKKKEGKTMEERAAERALQESAVEPPAEAAPRSGGKIGMEPRAISLGLFLAKITELAPPAVLKAPLRINGATVMEIARIVIHGARDETTSVEIVTEG